MIREEIILPSTPPFPRPSWKSGRPGLVALSRTLAPPGLSVLFSSRMPPPIVNGSLTDAAQLRCTDSAPKLQSEPRNSRASDRSRGFVACGLRQSKRNTGYAELCRTFTPVRIPTRTPGRFTRPGLFSFYVAVTSAVLITALIYSRQGSPSLGNVSVRFLQAPSFIARKPSPNTSLNRVACASLRFEALLYGGECNDLRTYNARHRWSGVGPHPKGARRSTTPARRWLHLHKLRGTAS